MRGDRSRLGFLRASNSGDCVVILVLAAILLNALLIVCACGPELPPKCGMIILSLEGEKDRLYLKRMARGLNYDGIVLSADPNPCGEGDPKRDLVFAGIAPFPVLFELKEGTLYVSSYTAVDNPELSSVGSIPIEYSYLGNLEQDTDISFGIVKAEVELDREFSLTIPTRDAGSEIQ